MNRISASQLPLLPPVHFRLFYGFRGSGFVSIRGFPLSAFRFSVFQRFTPSFP